MRLSPHLLTCAAVLSLGACGSGSTLSSEHEDAQERQLRAVATTPLIADLIRAVGGEDVRVDALVPLGADPHSHEPSLRDIRTIAYADVAFSNYLLLEEQSLIATIDAALPPGASHVSLAEAATRHGAEVISLVENAALDSTWLGLRVEGGAAVRLGRAAAVDLRATGVRGPDGGALAAYLTESFGSPTPFFTSADGFGDERADHRELPVDAHTHMSWAFTSPGAYELDLSADLLPEPGQPREPVAGGTVTFAVGIDPARVGPAGARVVRDEHVDITVDLAARRIMLRVDPASAAEPTLLDPSQAVIEVPPRTLTTVPADPAYRFIARPGQEVYQLVQAVLGAHVHGEIDPHLWHDVRNAIAYVKVIRDELAAADPEHEVGYRSRAETYIRRLQQLDQEVTRELAAIPEARRQLVTTHDAFGYLAHAYGLRVAGTVTPHPGIEPSVADRTRLTRTLQGLRVPAVFLTPDELRRSSVLAETAAALGVRTCPILGDTLTPEATSYIALMEHNAHSLRRCLS